MGNDQPSPRAWEPLTPRGVADFAAAPLRRLWLVQFIVAALVAGVVVWVLAAAFFPVVQSAIRQLPAQGEILNQKLIWPGDAPVLLAGNHALGLAVDLNHSGQVARAAQLQFEFGRDNLRVLALPGYAIANYPPGWRIAFNRTELDPWWGAWQPVILAAVAAGTVLVLLVSWTLLTTLYCLPLKIISLFENRDLTWPQSWRLAGAALMPGALFLTIALAAFGVGWIDLVQLGAAWGLHLIIGWIYLFISPLFRPRIPTGAVKSNPFAGKKSGRA